MKAFAQKPLSLKLQKLYTAVKPQNPKARKAPYYNYSCMYAMYICIYIYIYLFIYLFIYFAPYSDFSKASILRSQASCSS